VKPTPRDPLLIELIAAIGAGRIDSGAIHERGHFVYGWCDDKNGRVRFNPAPHAVLICLHEMIHRMRPAWTERGVSSRATRLLSQMSDQEVDRLYEVILSTARVRKRADIL